MHVVAMSNISGLNLFHPKYLSKTSDHFETKVKRGRKSKKDYGKALDKPEPVPACTSTPTQTTLDAPEVAHVEAPEIVPISKKVKKVKGKIPERKSSRNLFK